ncbi:MAG: SH3 domain-containing protein [Caldilineaceae bacterium]
MAVLLAVAACRGREQAAEETLVPETTPAAGGMVMPTATPTVAIEPSTPTAVLWRADQAVVATVVTLLYADASRQSTVMGQYDAATPFSVVQASGDYGAYPVETAGEMWYRVRTADGLVGWVPAEHLAVGE